VISDSPFTLHASRFTFPQHGERVQCAERTGEPRPLSIDREGNFSLTAKPYCDSLKLEIEVSPEIAGCIAVMLAAL
jgi:hypothetical protein